MSERFVVTGGAGFLGSHLCERLLSTGAAVVCVDNFLTGHRENLDDLVACSDGRLTVLEADVSVGVEVAGPIDAILHFASPASPPDYLAYPIETLRVGAN